MEIVARKAGSALRCPECGRACPGYDARRREWRDWTHVAPGRGCGALEAFYASVGKRRLAAVESVSMDMWRPYVAATEAWVADARRKTAFDRFHVAKHLADAVDKVRRAEHKKLRAGGNAALAGTRYQWLRGRGKKTHAEKLAFAAGGGIVSSPVILGDTVYFGARDGILYALNRADGAPVWTLDLGEPVELPPAYAEGRLYVRTADGRLHAVE